MYTCKINLFTKSVSQMIHIIKYSTFNSRWCVYPMSFCKVLIVQSQSVIKWVRHDTVQSVPSCAVWGGCSPDGRPSYVARVYNERYLPANYEEGRDDVEYAQNGPQRTNEWEYLVFNKEAAGRYTQTPFKIQGPLLLTQLIKIVVWISYYILRFCVM